MLSNLLIFSAVVAIYHPLLAVAAPGPLAPRAGVCDSGIYGELVPILSPYAIAQAFCTAYYPMKCPSAAAMIKRAATASSATTTKTTSVTSSKSKTTTSTDAKASAWSKCQGQGASVISTMCSCIEKPCPSKTTISSSPTKSTTTTTSSSPPAPTCTGASLTSSSGFTYCQLIKGNGFTTPFNNVGVRQGYTANDDADALQQCADVAVSGAASLRVFYTPSTGLYECDLADSSNCDTSNIADSSVAQYYVYNRVGTTC